MASNKQKMEQLFEAAQSVVSENRFQDALPRKVQKRNKLIGLLDAIEAELAGRDHDPRDKAYVDAVMMRDKLLAKLDKMGVGEKELRSIRGTRAAIDGMEGQEEAIDWDKEFEDAPADEEELATREKELRPVKLKGFGPDHAKGNMSNPAARAALMRKGE